MSATELEGQESDQGIADAGDMLRLRGWRAVLHRSPTGIFLVVTVVAIAMMLRSQDWSVLAATMLSGVSDDVTAVGGAARIFFVGQIAKYMPGKVFGFVVSIRMGKTMGAPAARTTSAWLLTLVID